MAIIKLQGPEEKRRGIYYQFDADEPPIGEGGMGKVYKGVSVNERTKAMRYVAIKCMYDDLPAHVYERARREAEIRLRNDNLIEMLAFIEVEDTRAIGETIKHYHVVSELLTGVSLSDVLNGNTVDKWGTEIPFAVKMLQLYKNDPELFASTVVMNILSGLMALHDAEYIHRDIDPSNIMLTADEHIKLIDFGIAKQMNTLTTNDRGLTVAGKFMGKPEYASPELALGDINHQNATTDIYAMGILFYQCILGTTPFTGPRAEVLEMQLKSKMPLNKIKNKTIRAIIGKACQKKQELRYQSSAQMRVAIETGNASDAPSPIKKWIILGIAAIAVIVATIISITIKQQRDEEKAKEVLNKRIETLTLNFQEQLNNAEELFQLGCDKSKDDYEDKLIDAYIAYTETRKLLNNDSLKNNISTTPKDIIQKRQEVADSLDASQLLLSKQADELANIIGETSEIVISYRTRATKIQKFKSYINENN